MEKMISIYVVEDYDFFRNNCVRTLKRVSDFEVLGGFSDAQSCISEMRRKAVDIILMDLGLSGMDGIEATKKIKSKYPKSKIIVLSSHQEDEDLQNSFDAGADWYLIKEKNTLDQLECVIKAVMHGGVNLITAKIAKAVLANTNKSENKYNLTPREFEVLEFVKRGKNNPQISKELHIAISTVKVHLNSIFIKLNVENRIEAAVLATEEKLV